LTSDGLLASQQGFHSTELINWKVTLWKYI